MTDNRENTDTKTFNVFSRISALLDEALGTIRPFEAFFLGRHADPLIPPWEARIEALTTLRQEVYPVSAPGETIQHQV